MWYMATKKSVPFIKIVANSCNRVIIVFTVKRRWKKGSRSLKISQTVLSKGRLKMENKILHEYENAIIGAGGNSKRILSSACTESDILYLQNIFTTPGVHMVTVPNILAGRKIIMEQLEALQWHQEIGFLTADQSACCVPAQNILSMLEQPIDQEGVETFFIERFYFDFLWIETTSGLVNMPWIYSFEKQLINYHLDSMIPIIILTYN